MNIDIADVNYDKKILLVNELYQVVDPELGINIIDLGMVYDIDVNENDKTVNVTMTLSTPSCPMGGIITNNVLLVTRQTFPGFQVNVNLTFDPRWSYEKVTETGRAMLGW